MPIAHRRVVRTTNLPERLFGEERRRTTVIPHAFGERAVLKLLYAALLRASASWRQILISGSEWRQLEALRAELDDNFESRTAQAVPVASRQRLFSEDWT